MSKLSEIIRYIPEAAESPYAFVAYALTLAAWVLLAWRTKRHKQLLDRLELIPKKDRGKILEAEMGSTRLRRSLNPAEWLRARIHFYMLVAFLSLCVVILAVVAIAITKSTSEDSRSRVGASATHTGVIQPGRLAGPASHCAAPSNVFRVHIGTNEFLVHGSARTTLVSYQRQPLLTLAGKGLGLLASTKVRSRDGRIVAELVDNEFHVNPNNYFRLDHSDPSRLVIYDQMGEIALDIRFFNPSVIRVSGHWNLPDGAQLEITDERVAKNGNPLMQSNCFFLPASESITMVDIQ